MLPSSIQPLTLLPIRCILLYSVLLALLSSLPFPHRKSSHSSGLTEPSCAPLIQSLPFFYKLALPTSLSFAPFRSSVRASSPSSVLIPLDLSVAFDTVYHQILLFILSDLRVLTLLVCFPSFGQLLQVSCRRSLFSYCTPKHNSSGCTLTPHWLTRLDLT